VKEGFRNGSKRIESSELDEGGSKIPNLSGEERQIPDL